MAVNAPVEALNVGTLSAFHVSAKELGEHVDLQSLSENVSKSMIVTSLEVAVAVDVKVPPMIHTTVDAAAAAAAAVEEAATRKKNGSSSRKRRGSLHSRKGVLEAGLVDIMVKKQTALKEVHTEGRWSHSHARDQLVVHHPGLGC